MKIQAVTVKEAAAALGCSIQYIYRRCALPKGDRLHIANERHGAILITDPKVLAQCRGTVVENFQPKKK